VSSEQGKLIWMANTKHCPEVREANDHQRVGCRVMEDQKLGNTAPSSVRSAFKIKPVVDIFARPHQLDHRQ
jgi:hypothetical protein